MAAARQLLVDISVLVHQDDQTGVQRVVRNLLQALHAAPPPDHEVAAIYDAGGYYAYAQDYAESAADEQPAPRPIEVCASDIFLGLDLCPDHLPGNRAVLDDLRRHGVQLYFVVYDLLPIRLPEMFSSGAAPWFTRWLQTVCTLADGLLCISRAVEDDLRAWLEQAGIVRDNPLRLAHFPLGSDLNAAPAQSATYRAEQQDPEPGLAALLQDLEALPTLLMVGTLEPRKMHSQTLDALDLLWQEDVPVRLVIVGKSGWMTEQLADRIHQHRELGRRLFWLDHASDAVLLQLYRGCAALLAASAGEGYGLPLIEAARHALPIIARDIPVFREVCSEHAHYFAADADAAGISAAIGSWLVLTKQGLTPDSSGIQRYDWADSALALTGIIMHQRWHSIGPSWLP